MDPEANISEQRALSASILDIADQDRELRFRAADIMGQAVRLAELAQALDAHLSTGGAFPLAWTSFRGRPREGAPDGE